LVIKTLDPYWIRIRIWIAIQPKMLDPDPDPYKMNTDPQPWFKYRLLIAGQYICFAKNEWGTAASNSVFVRQSVLNNFKEEPPITKSVEEGRPFQLPCESPDGWPKPNVYWMIQVES
jgi:hypothetical protein